MICAKREFVMLDLLKYGVVITMAVAILNAAAYAEDKTTVMLGSHYWDIDNQHFGKSDTADFLWIFGIVFETAHYHLEVKWRLFDH